MPDGLKTSGLTTEKRSMPDAMKPSLPDGDEAHHG